MKPGPPIVEIHNGAGIDAGNAVKMKQCELIDFSALLGPTLNHENIPNLNVQAITRSKFTVFLTIRGGPQTPNYERGVPRTIVPEDKGN